MGRRTRRRGGSTIAPPAEPPTPEGTPAPAAAAAPRRSPTPHHVTPDRRASLGEAPKAPWAPFPLTELTILVGIVLIVIGFVSDGDRVLWLGVGFALVSLAAAELSLREHLAGYRSHSALLGAIAAIAFVAGARGVLTLVGGRVPQEVLTIIGIVIFGVVLTALRRLFQRRAGGLGFRV